MTRAFTYDASYPPSILKRKSTGATAGIPGTWTPAGSTPPASVAALQASSVVASPLTGWTSGQYVQTGTVGAPGRACWTGTGWVGGAAPLMADDQAAVDEQATEIPKPEQSTRRVRKSKDE